MVTEAQKRASARYAARATKQLSLKLHNKNDADILDALEGKAKQTEIKRLIRLGMKHDKAR